jgi:preprotein translocase subunit SecY
MNVFQALYNALRLPELRRKILVTLGILVIFRVFANIPLPYANAAALQSVFGQSELLGLLNLFSGGGLATFSLVAMGLNPFINATIIIQLLTVISERVKEISKEGELGQQRITRWTRWLTVGLAALQAYGFTVLFQSSNPPILPATLTWEQRLFIILALTTGSILLMWLGELISEYGIGNGISLLIFAGIIGTAPSSLFATVSALSASNTGFQAYIPLIGFAIIALLVTAFIIEVQQAVRRVPIQSAQRVVGRQTIQSRASHLPLRVNQAGVIPIIFAISVMFFPTFIANFFSQLPHQNILYQVSQWINANFVPTSPNLSVEIPYNVVYFLLVMVFTYFYTAVTFDPYDAADNLKKYSSFIPGIRPGQPTAEYLGQVMARITFAGGLFLGFITVVLPLLTSSITGISRNQLYLGGTAILIVVGVALDTMKQLEAQLLMRQYRGFIR